MSRRWLHILLLLGAFGSAAACSATPIQLPGNDDKTGLDAAAGSGDSGRSSDGAQVAVPDGGPADMTPAGDDGVLVPGDGGPQDATDGATDAVIDATTEDGATDAVIDATTEDGAPDAVIDATTEDLIAADGAGD